MPIFFNLFLVLISTVNSFVFFLDSCYLILLDLEYLELVGKRKYKKKILFALCST